MTESDTAAQESAATTRRIDSDRIHRALTEDLSIAVVAPAQYAVFHDDRRYDVDVEMATCDCPDATYRDVACKHLLAAAAFHAFLDESNPRFVARVVARMSEHGCAHDVRGCGGPVTLGARGIPCEGCLSVTPGHWTVWNRLSNSEVVAPDHLPAAESALSVAVDGATVATDGGSPADDGDDEGDEDDTMGYERPTRSEPADFGGGESSGVEEL